MKAFLKGALIGGIVSAVVTVCLVSIATLGNVPEQSIVQAANPGCAPVQLKMPCFQSHAQR